MNDVQLGLLISGVAIPLWLIWIKALECFGELVRIRHELEDAAKDRKRAVVIK